MSVAAGWKRICQGMRLVAHRRRPPSKNAAPAPALVKKSSSSPFHLPLPCTARSDMIGRPHGNPVRLVAGSNHTLFPTARKERGETVRHFCARRAQAVRAAATGRRRAGGIGRAESSPMAAIRAKFRRKSRQIAPSAGSDAVLSYIRACRGIKCRDSQWSRHDIRAFENLREVPFVARPCRPPPCLAQPRSRTARCSRRMAPGRSSATRRPAPPPSNAR